MSAVVGIDLGTTNTVVGTVQAGRAMALANERGERLLPSVVSFHPNGSVLVGKEAKLRRLQDAANTVYSTKRLIGRTFGSEEVKKARARSAFQLQEGPGHGVLVVARGETYTLSEISAFVLKEARRVAEAALNDKVDRAVITVPANFNDLQRAATKVAGHIAGLEVMRILNEPTAAALAYGYGKATQERIAVYDFGGGTFDVTILDLAGNVFEVISTAGDTFLGGDDLDQLIADRMADRFLATHRYDPRSDRQVFERLLAAAEEVKIALSASETTTVQLREVAYGVGGKALDMPFTMTRVELEELAAPLVDRTLKVCGEALAIARLEPRSLDQVIVVGGSTRMPIVRRRVAEFFGRKPLDHLSPDEVVAMGAAIQAAALAGSERKRGGTAPGITTTDSAMSSRKGRAAATNPGLGRPNTQPGLGDGETTDLMTRPPDVVPPAPPRAPTTLVSGKDRYEGPQGQRSLQATHGGSDLNVPLPLVTSGDDDDTQTGARRVEPEIPTELRSASVMFGEIGGPLAGPEDGPLAPPTKPRLPPPPPAGVTTARMPSAPPLAPPERRAGPVPVVAPPAGPVGTTTARMASAPPAPLPPPPRGPKGTVVQTGDQGSNVAAAAVAAAAAGAAAAVVAAPLRAAPPVAETPAVATPPGAGRPMAPAPQLVSGAVAQAPAAPVVPAAPARAPATPLLLDVTPLSLAVETVGGYCDVIIERNTPVPCERTRMFATAADNQTAVNINVAQGESNRFAENTMLGHVELTGIRPAGRGEVQIAVTFAIDADGILGVKAVDQATGQQTAARIRLGGSVPSQAEMDQMRQRIATR
jgi:molecular chaperone DnaK